MKVLSDSTDLLRQIAEDLFTPPERLTEDSDSKQASFVDFSVNRSRCDEVENCNGFAELTVAINTAYPLLHTHRIPRQVVVNDGIAKLVIEALASHLRGEQQVYCARVFLRQAEPLPQLSSILLGDVTMYEANAKPHLL